MKKVLSLLYEKYKLIEQKISYPFVCLCSKNKFLSKLFFLFSNDFNIEYNEVLNGKKEFLSSHRVNEFQLRRNIHRLEKAISLPNRRDEFALGYIKEAVYSYIELIKKTDLSVLSAGCSSVKWYHSVLKQYFEIVTGNKMVSSLKEEFDNANQELMKKDSSILNNTNKVHLIDVSKNKIPNCYSGFAKLIKARRSIRHYQSKEVSDDIIKKSIDLARHAPSACNRQPLRFIIVKDEKKVKDIHNLILGNSGFSENIPGMAVVVGNLEAFYETRDRHIMYIDSSLAAMNFVNALASQSVGSCCMNWTSVPSREKKMRKLLNIKSSEHFVMFISFGYADESVLVPSSCKISMDKVVEIIK